MLYYETILNGSSNEWMTLIHCLGGSTKTWKKQTDFFSKHFNLLLIDLPYHGKSTDYKEDFNIKNINNSIKEILDSLNITKTHFMSFSLGTMVASYFVSQYPKYALKVVLGGCSISVSKGQKSLVNLINKTKSILPYKMVYKTIATIMLPKEAQKKSREIMIREIMTMKKEHFLAWIDYICKAVTSAELITNLQLSNIPVLILTSDRDFCFLKGSMEAHKNIKNSTLRIIEKCGHICIMEKADKFNDLSLKFIENYQ